MALESLPKIAPALFSAEQDLIQIYNKKSDTTGVINPSYIKSSPSGVAGAIQFSDGSAFASSSNLTWNNATNALGLGSGTTSAFIDFASNPAGSTTIVGAIRTYVDGTNLSDVMEFMENGNIGVPTALSLTKLNVVTPYSALNTDFTFSNADTINAPASLSYSSFTSSLRLSKAYSTVRITNYGGNADVSILGSGGPAGFLQLNQNGGSPNVSLNGEAAGYSYFLTNVGFGLSTTPTAKLQIKGSGSTSATTSLLVQNSSGTDLLKVTDDGNVFLGSQKNITWNTGNFIVGDTTANTMTFYVASSIGFQIGASTNSIQRATSTRELFPSSDNSFDFGQQFGRYRNGWFGGQLKIGDATAVNVSAKVQIDSTTQGFLPPRMTDAQIRAIATPAEGLIAYNTDISHLCCYQAGAWVKLSHSPM